MGKNMEADKSDAIATITARATNSAMQKSAPGQVLPDSMDPVKTLECDPPIGDRGTNNQITIVSKKQQDVLNRLDLAPATLEALKTLSAITASEGIETLSTCDKLTASLEQIRAKKNMKLFEKLDKIRQDFSGLNHKIAKMEESIYDLREVTSNLVKSLPPSVGEQQPRPASAVHTNKGSNDKNDKRLTSATK